MYVLESIVRVYLVPHFKLENHEEPERLGISFGFWPDITLFFNQSTPKIAEQDEGLVMQIHPIFSLDLIYFQFWVYKKNHNFYG